MTPTQVQKELCPTRNRPALLRKSMACLNAVVLVATLGAASCQRGTSTPAEPALTYPKLPASPVAYKLADPGPGRYEIAYESGRLLLRKESKETWFQLSFRVDRAKKDNSELVSGNKAVGDKSGWKMELISPDGGRGYRAEYKDGADHRLFYFFGNGIVGATLSVNLGPGNDATLRAAAEELIASFRWDESKLAGAMPVPDPPQPFTYMLPRHLAGQEQVAVLRDFTVTLWYDKQPVQVVASVVESADMAKQIYTERHESIAKAGATIRALKDQHDDAEMIALSKKVDEGYLIKVTTNGQPKLGALVLRRGALYCVVSVSAIDGPMTLEAAPALVAPFDIARTISFRD